MRAGENQLHVQYGHHTWVSHGHALSSAPCPSPNLSVPASTGPAVLCSCSLQVPPCRRSTLATRSLGSSPKALS